jgi:PAS domain S-box-containing protein
LRGKLLLVNQKLCDFLGSGREELIGKRFQEITHPEDGKLELKYLHQLLAGEIEYYAVEKRYVCKEVGDLTVVLTTNTR